MIAVSERTPECIDDSEIERFNLGLLSADEEGRIDRHIESCESCLHRSTDYGWRSGADVTQPGFELPYVNEPQCASMQESVRNQIVNLSVATSGTCGPQGSTFIVQRPAGSRTLHLLDQLGQGRMGVVFRGRQVLLERDVAVKALASGGPLDARRRARLLKEARAVARLSHPNIVSAFDVIEGETDEVAALFVMELVVGDDDKVATLEDRLKTGPLSGREAAAIVVSLCGAVQHAHDKGIVHRDLKPANILVGRDGVLKIADFGIATVAERHCITGAGGTPLYMAPEQWRIGPPRRESDVYALGAILYELLTGKTPFNGSVEELRQRIERELPKNLRSAGVHRDLSAIVDKCLRKEPEDRYRSATELGDDLRRFLERRPVAARRPALWERPVYGARRPAVYGGATLAAVVVVSGMVLSLWNVGGRPTRGARTETNVLVEADRLIVGARNHCELGDVKGGLEAFLEAREMLPEGHARRAYIDSCLEHWSRRLPAVRATYSFPQTINFVAEGTGRDFFLSGDFGGNVRQVFFDERPSKRWHVVASPVKSIAVSTDSGFAAVAGSDEVGLLDLSTGTIRQPLKIPRLTVTTCGFLKHGKVIVTASRGDAKPLRLWEAASGEEIPFDCPERGEVERWYPSKDGSLAAATFSDGRCWIWGCDTATPMVMLPAKGSKAVPVAFLGRTIATGGDSLRLWNDRGERVDEMPVPYKCEIVHLVACDDKSLLSTWKYGSGFSLQSWRAGEKKWSERIAPNSESVSDRNLGRSLSPSLMICDQSNVCDLQAVASGVETLCLPSGLEFEAIQFCQNERQVVAATVENHGKDTNSRSRLVHLVAWDIQTGTEALAPILLHRSPLSSMAVNEASGFLASSTMFHNEIVITPISGSGGRRRLIGHSDSPASLALHPDGKRLLSGGRDGTVRLWDIAANAQSFQEKHDSVVMVVAFSPLGELAASADGRGELRLWAVNEKLWPLANIAVGYPVRSIAFSEHGDRLAVGGDKGQVKVFFAGASGLQLEREVLTNGYVSGLCFLRNDTELVVATQNIKDAVAVYDTTFWEPVGRAGGVGGAYRLSRAESGRFATIRSGTSIALEPVPATPAQRTTAEWHSWINARTGKNITVGD